MHQCLVLPLKLVLLVSYRGHQLRCLRVALESICCTLVAIRGGRLVEAGRDLLLSHHLLELVAEALALGAVGLALHEKLVDLRHLD